MTLDEAKKAISNKSCLDFHYKNDDDGEWKWMIPLSLSDDETTLYYKRNGITLSANLENIVVDKFR